MTNSCGNLMPIGGAEERVRNRVVLRRFVEICGGSDARIAIIPTASRLEDIGAEYESIFGELDAGASRTVEVNERTDAEDTRWVETIDWATGVFFTGGNQLRLSTILGGTAVGNAIRQRHREGLHVGGTSAGAAILSEHMIAFGREGSTPIASMVTLSPGLGLTNDVIIDQHFRQRDRLGRLVTALSFNPFAVGMGLDEDTAAIIRPDRVLEVCGSGAITIVDPSDVEYSSMDSARPDDPITILGLRLHLLTDGGSFDIERRTARAAPARKA